jgi:hypothetical protein
MTQIRSRIEALGGFVCHQSKDIEQLAALVFLGDADAAGVG